MKQNFRQIARKVYDLIVPYTNIGFDDNKNAPRRSPVGAAGDPGLLDSYILKRRKNVRGALDRPKIFKKDKLGWKPLVAAEVISNFLGSRAAQSRPFGIHVG